MTIDALDYPIDFAEAERERILKLIDELDKIKDVGECCALAVFKQKLKQKIKQHKKCRKNENENN